MKLRYFLLFTFLSSFAIAQLVVTNGATPATLVNSLLGGGITVSNVTFQGVFNSGGVYQAGSFSASGSVATNLGMTSGIVLCTGKTNDIVLTPTTTAPGASNFTSSGLTSTCANGEIRQGGSCPVYINDLDVLAGSVNYYNAAILEFDFVATNTNISFRYVFGSEEYDQTGSSAINYNCSTYNDKFGFIISGPGITGGQGYTNNGKNIARLANGSEVSINSVNDGVVGSYGGSPSAANCLAANSSWVNGTPTSEFKGAIYGIQFNGNTKVLTASQSGLTAGSTYHIKLIITDANDGAYDSGVFIEAGSFTSPTTLPITLINFDGFCEEGGIELNWQTASEKYNQRFFVERSDDGINFETIAEIPGSVSSSKIIQYYFKDAHPINGTNYYRLKQQDMNGKMSVFKVISVEASCLNNEEINFSIFPNPANQNLFVDFNLNRISDISFEVYNTIGQVVKEIPYKHYDKGFQNLNIDVSDLPVGVYYFRTLGLHTKTALKFIKH